MESVYVLHLLFWVGESVNERQSEPESVSSFLGVYEVVSVSVCNSCPVPELYG